MPDIEYEFFMSQIKHICDIEENSKTKISLVFYEGIQGPCVLKICMNRDLSKVYQVLTQIRHPNVAIVYDYLYADGNTYVIEEFVAGKTLQELLYEKGVFLEKETIRIISSVCQGLEVFHSYKPPVIHNDIKTSNIMVREDGSVKLMDFDITRIYREGAEKNTRLFGTEEYASPEHYGFGQSEPSTDIYSLGVTMHEMLTGEGLTNEHKMTYHGKLSKIIRKCIEVDRTKRYQSALQLRRDLEKCQKRKYLWIIGACIFLLVMILACAASMITPAENVVENNDEVLINPSDEEPEIAGAEEIVSTGSESDLQEVQSPVEIESKLPIKKMDAVYQITGELKSMVALDNGIFVILEEISGQYYIRTSDGVEVPLDIHGNYGAKLIYDNYSKSLYLLEYESSVINVYRVNGAYELENTASLKSSQSSDKSHISCSFFSDGRMLCNTLFQIIDSNTWMVVGDAPAASYVIGDKMYQFDSGTFVEVDLREKVIEEYSMKEISATCFWDQVYVNGSGAYFIGYSDSKSYVYRFNGESFEAVICLNDYDGYSDFAYDYLCVTENAVRCYDERQKVIKEFLLE